MLPVTQPGGRDPQAEDLDRRFAAELGGFLASHCLECHSGQDPKGDLQLDHLRGVEQANAANLRLIRDMIVSGEMPPKKKPRPDEHARTLAVQWLDAMIAYVPADAPVDPGWMTPHRLNRAEYRLTMRDLLGIDPSRVDVAERLPRDDTGYGFDNIADVLSVSPLAVEEYLAAAERAVERALGPVVQIGDTPISLRPIRGDPGQPLPRGGFYLFGNGAAKATFRAPAEAEYIIRVRAFETRAGSEHANLSLRVDGKGVGEFRVDASRDEPKEYTARVRLREGERAIAAHFTNDYYVKDKADRNLGIESITVAGPVDAASIARTPAYRSIFGVAVEATQEDDRARAILRAFASRAYRRPAEDRDVEGLLGVYASERAAGRGFEEAVRAGLTAALVSPRFLFRTIRHPDPVNPGVRYTLDGFELASRLSYFLWSSMPDETLARAAEDGSLLTDEGLRAQVRRMIADTKADALVEHFAGQWLQLRSLETLAIDRSAFPEYDDRLRADMREEAELFFAHLLRGDRPVLDLIDSRYSFVNERLARHYGIPGVAGEQFRRVDLPTDSPRGGVLTMGAVLTITSNPTRTSPVKRGLFVLDQMLGTPPPPPPPDIPPLEQATNLGPNPTVREQLAAHTTVASCAACHNRLDPIGLSFEHFDAVGKWRREEGGRAIDASGVLPTGEPLSGSADLKRVVLSRSDQFIETLTAKMLTYALGRGVEPFDRPAVRRIAARTRAEGDRLPALIESIVLSETFRTARGRERTK